MADGYEVFLSGTALFRGIAPAEIRALLPCLRLRHRSFAKEEIILRAGECVTELGLVLQGSVNIVVNFYWGGSNIFGHIPAGEIFAESYAAVPGRELLCDAVAAEACEVLFLDVERILNACEKQCRAHRQLIRNLLRMTAQKNLNLSDRMMHIAPKSIRERLLSYFSEQALSHGSAHFRIPFSRQQLADYLGVDRSALSNELSKMQRDGLIVFRKNEFTLRVKQE